MRRPDRDVSYDNHRSLAKFCNSEMKKAGLKWSPTVPCRKPDNIVSSKARENGETGFKPSYDNERKENMNFIMSNEYMRIWFKERSVYEVDTYSKLEVEAGAGEIKRRFVQRYMRNKKQNGRVLPPIKLKRFVNATSKTEHKRTKVNPATNTA